MVSACRPLASGPLPVRLHLRCRGDDLHGMRSGRVRAARGAGARTRKVRAGLIAVAALTAAGVLSIAGASSGAVLDLAVGCFYKLTAGLVVAVSLTINGRHATIQPAPSAPAMSMLTLANAVDVSINEVTIIRGNGAGGGAAIKEAGTGTLTLSQATSPTTGPPVVAAPFPPAAWSR